MVAEFEEQSDAIKFCKMKNGGEPETITITVNGREFKLPKPETKPTIDHRFYYIPAGSESSGVARFSWYSKDPSCGWSLKNGLVHLSEEKAFEWAKLWQFMTGGGE